MGSVRANGFRPIGVDGAYAAFPSVCRFGSGQLRLVWRQGTDHVTTRDGDIHTSTSTDNGRTWTTATIAVNDTLDLRDPCISAVGSTTYLTYFKGTSTLAAAGCFLRTSTNDGVSWTATETRVDAQPYAAMCAPVIQIGTTLATAYYGKTNLTDTFDSCWLATSTNGGATWTRQLVANGPAAGRDYQEPWLVTRGTEVWMFFRYGNQSAIGSCVSTNSGSTWSAPAQLFDDTTGRPAAAWLSTGTMAVVARQISTRQAVVRSRNPGAAQNAWLPPRPTMVQPSSGPIGMMYAHPLEIPGGVICPVGIETSGTVSRIHVGWLADDGGVSPLGDHIPDDRTATLTGADQLLFAEGFSQVNGNLQAPWTVGAGGIQVSNGYAVSTVADNVVDLAWVDVASADADLEGDFWYTGQAGFGLIARANAAANTYLLFTSESGGTMLRLYKVVSGTATALAANPGSANDSSWTRLRMVVRNNVIRCHINDTPVLGHELGGTDATLFAGQPRHGIKLNASGGVQRCRRFVARG